VKLRYFTVSWQIVLAFEKHSLLSTKAREGNESLPYSPPELFQPTKVISSLEECVAMLVG
jgi:hypothetical protein